MVVRVDVGGRIVSEEVDRGRGLSPEVGSVGAWYECGRSGVS